MSESWLGLEGSVVAVTGGASGTGAAIVTTLNEAGATPVILDLQVETDLDAPQPTVQVDVTDAESVNRAFSSIEDKFGKLDGVVNVRGVFLTAQAAAKIFAKQGYGTIINMSSEAGLEGSVGQSANSATKGAVNSFTRSWGRELGPLNIRVVGVAPGINEPTGLTTPAYNEALAYTRHTAPDKLTTDYKNVIPLGRPGKFTDIGNLVTYLLSDRAAYVSGTTYAVTGGKSRG